MDEAEAIAALDRLSTDSEVAHSAADDILVSVVPPKVREAYERAKDRCGGWWYA